MILLLLLASILSTNPRPSCPDFSGHYVMQAEDGRIYLTVMQTGCERIAINWNNYLHADTASALHILQLDGRFRPDFGWFGFRNLWKLQDRSTETGLRSQHGLRTPGIALHGSWSWSPYLMATCARRYPTIEEDHTLHVSRYLGSIVTVAKRMRQRDVLRRAVPRLLGSRLTHGEADKRSNDARFRNLFHPLAA